MSYESLRDVAVRKWHRTDWSDPRQRFLTESYLMAHNARVPPEFRVGEGVTLSLEIEARDARSQAQATDYLNRAVTLMAKDLRSPDKRAVPTAYDYARTPLQMTSTATGLRFRAPRDGDPEDLFEGSIELQTVTDIALMRLVDLLPSASESREDQQRHLDIAPGTRSNSRQAIKNLAELAQHAHGASFALLGREEPPRVLTVPLADELAEAVDTTRTMTSTRQYVGMLDGMRTTRRLFYLQSATGTVIPGSVDERILARVRSLIGRDVLATVEVTETERAGVRGRPSYRLTGVEPRNDEDLLTQLATD